MVSLLLLPIFSALNQPVSASPDSISTDKKEYYVGEIVTVTYTISGIMTSTHFGGEYILVVKSPLGRAESKLKEKEAGTYFYRAPTIEPTGPRRLELWLHRWWRVEARMIPQDPKLLAATEYIVKSRQTPPTPTQPKPPRPSEEPRIEIELPVKLRLTLKEVLIDGKVPWLDVYYDRIFKTRDQKFLNYINNVASNPSAFLNEDYRFGSLNTWIGIRNLSQETIQLYRVYIYIQCHEIINDRKELMRPWNYEYIRIIQLNAKLGPGEYKQYALSNIPLYFANPFPPFPENPNIQHQQTYLVSFRVAYEQTISLRSSEFPVHAISVVDKLKYEVIKKIFTKAFAYTIESSGGTLQFILELLGDITDVVRDFFNSRKTTLAFLSGKGEDLLLHTITDKQEVKDNVATVNLGNLLIASIPDDRFQLAVDGNKAQEQNREFTLNVISIRDWQLVEVREKGDSVKQGSIKRYDIAVSESGKEINVAEAREEIPMLYIGFATAAIVAIAIFVVKKRKRPKTS